MRFIIFIFILVVVFYVISFIIKLFFRRMMRNGQNEKRYKQKEGNIVISEDPSKKPKVDPNIGEYTDFEEIKK